MSHPPLDVEVRLEDGPTHRLRLPGDAPLLIGRSRRALVRLPAAEVSGAHARILIVGEALRVEDLGSENGTWLEGTRLPAGRPTSLPPGAALTIGPYHVATRFAPARDASSEAPPDRAAATFEQSTGGPAAALESTDALAARLVRELLAAGAAPPATVEVEDPRGQQHRAVLRPGQPLRVGRAPECELAVDDPDLSRVHAELLFDPGATALDGSGLTMRDLDSKNGVWRGETRLTGRCAVGHGDVLRLGGTTLRVQDPAEAWLEDPETLADAEALAVESGAYAPSGLKPASPDAADSLPEGAPPDSDPETHDDEAEVSVTDPQTKGDAASSGGVSSGGVSSGGVSSGGVSSGDSATALTDATKNDRDAEARALTNDRDAETRALTNDRDAEARAPAAGTSLAGRAARLAALVVTLSILAAALWALIQLLS